MKKILAIGGSNSKTSINKMLATYIASKVAGAAVTTLDWDHLVLPLYSVDLEANEGIPEAVIAFKKQIEDTDSIVLSVAENNGNITAAFKNLWDWTSRLDPKVWMSKPLFLAATSPGGRGGMNALEITKNLMPHYGGNLIVDFSLPSFYDNFKEGTIADAEKLQELTDKIEVFSKSV
ncbi:MAG: chromate reductase [Bacteroidia bacterium]|jgi:chromate reductase